MLPEGDDDVLMRDQLRMPSCPGKSGQAGRKTSRDRKRVAENLGNEGVGKSEGANESCRSVKEGLTEMRPPKEIGSDAINQLQSEMGPPPRSAKESHMMLTKAARAG